MDTLLIVEDEKLIRRGLESMLQRAPVAIKTILSCKNGEEALEILRNHVVDVLFTDIRMPKMDGITLVQEIQNMEQPPLSVVISGHDDFSYAVEMLRHGVKDYLLKPVDREQVYSLLETLEQELQQSMDSRRNKQKIFRHVLRVLMTEEYANEEEYQSLHAQYAGGLPARYRAICTHERHDELERSQQVIRVKDAHAFVIYFVAEEVVPAAETMLSGSYGISGIYDGLASIAEAYREALGARKAAFFHREESGASPVEVIPEADLERMARLLSVSRWQEIVLYWEQQFSRVRRGELSPDAVLTALEKQGAMMQEAYGNLLPAGEQLLWPENPLHYANVEAYAKALSKWLEDFGGWLSSEFEDYRNKQKIRTAVLYIQKHYAQPINMATVSNEISMNYSLFSYLFKQYTGRNFVEYLRRMRIRQAQKLLLETDWRVRDIGVSVGFQDEKYFLKIFKTICGISPSEYRRTGILEPETFIE